MLNNEQKKLVTSVVGHLGVSRTSLQKYHREDKYPEELALRADRTLKGRVSAVQMCPDTLGLPLHCHIKLAEQCVTAFTKDVIEGESFHLYISILNFFEEQFPTLYVDLTERIGSTTRGESFLQKRELHRGNF